MLIKEEWHTIVLLRITALVATVLACVAGAFAMPKDSVVLRTSDIAVTADVGGVRNLDTYLSPIRYSGMHLRLGFEYLRPMRFLPESFVHQAKFGLEYDKTENLVGNNTMHAVAVYLGWGMMKRWRNVLLPGLHFYGGGQVAFEGGVTYNPRNSNNVCSPAICLNAGLAGMAVYRFRLGKLPMTVRYQPTIPVIGGYYLPDYDQSFYEIYLGNWKNTVNFGCWANRFDMENLVTVDLHFGERTLRLGYRNNVTTLWKNNISVQRTVHALVVGIAWESLRVDLRRGNPLSKARIISAMY